MKHSFKKSILILTTALLAMLLLSCAAFADGACSLTLAAADGDTPVPGLTEKLYFCGELSKDGLVFVGPFADYRAGEPLPDSQSEWSELAADLNGFIDANGIEPLAVGTTDANGYLRFENLEEGLYFVAASTLTADKAEYSTSAFFVCLTEDEPNVTAKLKLSSVSFPERKVFKVWNDAGREDERPESITVVLYCDGEEYERVELSKENDWRYSWILPPGHTWTLSEITPEGYTSKVEQDGAIFTVTNTSDTPDNPPPLPQTGLLWWPVFLFAVLSVGVLVVVIRLRRAEGSDAKNPVRLLTGISLLLFSVGLVWTCANLCIGKHGGDAAELALTELREVMPTEDDASNDMAGLPDYLLEPDAEMPVRTVDGIDYIAQLYISPLELTLPVASGWSYSTLKLTPCRYSGSAYSGDLVLMAHNYAQHFGGIGQLKKGDEIVLTDMDGNRFFYQVDCVEILGPTAVKEVVESSFDLSLFTCTVGGKQRICVRCELVNEQPFVTEPQ